MVQLNNPGRKIRRLICDIETSPNIVLAFSAGYNLTINHDSIIHERKVICIGYKWHGEKKVTILRWDENQDDRKMLQEFFKVAEEADEIVAHFGAHFDVPWLRTRCLYHRLDPVPLYKVVDTKALASKYFYFNSNKLDYISNFLGHGKKLETKFELWKDILLKNCKKSLDYMCKYCGVDVLKLEKVFDDILPYIKPKTHAGVVAGRENWTCPRTGSENVKKSKTIITAAGVIQHQMKNVESGGFFTISDSAFKKYQEMRKKKKKPVRY